MAEMRKLKVVVLEDDIDTVLRFLGEASVAHFVDMRERQDDWKETLTPSAVPAETLAKCTEIKSRIDTLLDCLRSVPPAHEKEVALEEASAPKEPAKEVLARVEQKLAEMPRTRMEALAKCSPLLSIIDQFIIALKVKREDVRIEDDVMQKPMEVVLADVEYELSELRKTAESLGLIECRPIDFGLESSPFVERIRVSAKKRDVDFGRELAEQRRHYIEVEKNVARRLFRLEKIVEKAKESIETEIKPEQIRKDLLMLKIIVNREEQVARMQEEFVRSAKTIYFEAWVPQDHAESVAESIRKATGNSAVIAEELPKPEESPPLILKPVPSYLNAFAKLVYSFGYPSQGDVNPIHVLAITFPILFGIMFADVGQGALFVGIGALLTVLKRKINLEKASDIIQYLLVSSEMLLLLGVSAILFGFIFGEFFGPSGVIHPIAIGRLGPFYIGGFEPTEEPMKMLKFALLVGVVHLTLGLILKFANELRHKHYKLAPVPVLWMWLMLGGLFMWAYWGGISNISKWFAEGMFMLMGLIVLPLIGIIICVGHAEGFMEGIGFGVEVFAETLSHAMSYSRLMALGLIHSAMNYLFLVLGGVEHGHFPLGSIPLIAIGTVLVMIVEGLVVFVHTLRLHWVEWFSKFHSGEGIAFKPFKFT